MFEHPVLRQIKTCVILLSLVVFVVGCGSEPDPRGERVGVSGTVTLDGVPLASGTIRLISDQGNGSLKATAQITDGAFALDAQNGPLTGTVRVEVTPPEPELEQFEKLRDGEESGFTPIYIPARYNLESELTATIEPGVAEQQLTFDLKTK